MKIRIKKVSGQWYAFATGGCKRSRNLALVPAITFCKTLNKREQP